MRQSLRCTVLSLACFGNLPQAFLARNATAVPICMTCANIPAAPAGLNTQLSDVKKSRREIQAELDDFKEKLAATPPSASGDGSVTSAPSAPSSVRAQHNAPGKASHRTAIAGTSESCGKLKKKA